MFNGLYVLFFIYLVYRNDFQVQFNHDAQPNISVFQLLCDMSSVMLDKSNKLYKSKDKSIKTSGGVYYRILWSKCKFCNFKVCMYVCMVIHDQNEKFV